MPRSQRCFTSDVTQHVIQRGNNRRTLFEDAFDYLTFRLFLRVTLGRFGVDLHAYVLMKNHAHLMMTPHSTSAISNAMQWLGGRYAQYFNRRYGRTGALYEGRFRAWTLDSERYWLTCMRYIELNPVRAGHVTSPDQCAWSSYSCHGLGHDDPLITAHPLYVALAAEPPERQAIWRKQCGVTQTREEIDIAWRASRGLGKI